MPEIDPSQPPVSSEELKRDALATGADPDAPPLIDAEDDGEDRAHGDGEAIETGLTRLPPG